MSEAAESTEATPRKGKKRLVIGALAGLVLLGGGGGAAWYLLKGAPDEAKAAAAAEARRQASRTFVTLEPFVVNLADRQLERYVQVGLVLEVEGKDANRRITERMPAVRNQILLLLSSKLAADLISREGKERLAAEIAVAAAGPLGWTPPKTAPEPGRPAAQPRATGQPEKAGPSARNEKAQPSPPDRTDPAPNPIASVHFASFIVQ